MHLLANGLTCIPQVAWLHPELRHHLPALEHIARVLTEGRHNIEALIPEVKGDVFKALAWLHKHRVPDTSAYTIPFLSPEYCDLIVQEGMQYETYKGYTPNEEEDEEYRIPEFVLQNECPRLAACMEVLFNRGIIPASKIVYSPEIPVLTSVQLARYEPRGVAHGNWHVDGCSDLSVVVSLAPELFTGGGTDIRTGPMNKVHVPKLPKGHALMFHGKTTLHRGCAVESGQRDLLVFWSEYKDGHDS